MSAASNALRRSGFASVTRRTFPSRTTFSALMIRDPMVSAVPAKLFTVELERVQKTATMFRKRPETRARRIAATVERVRSGKPQRG
jgi:hypothetical protein